VTSAVVVAEVLGGARNLTEQREIDRLFAALQVHHVEAADSAESLVLLRQFRLSHNVSWHDCLIAAAARRLRMPVATLNERHFNLLPGVAVTRPY
jgi:predicted nucleic acid-binding protein